MTDLTRKDAIAVLVKKGTPAETIVRIKAHWAQLSWRLSAQDLEVLVGQLNLQSDLEKEQLSNELRVKLESIIGELK